MTIKDVLRESAGGNDIAGDVPLDDKAETPNVRFFGLEKSRNRIVVRFLAAISAGPTIIVQRLALVTVILCVSSIFVLTLRPSLTTRQIHKSGKTVLGKTVSHPGLSPGNEAILNLMPASIGNWTRNETDNQVLDNPSSQTYASTYRLGTSRVQLWVTKASAVPVSSTLINFEGSSRKLHTDTGVSILQPNEIDFGGKSYVMFDYNPAHTGDQYWISTSPFTPALAHTQSWYQSPYVVTVGSDVQKDRDNFFNALASKPI
jgi:hypothetical protein